MSVLAVITIHKCDGCGEIATVQTDEDCNSFAANWFAGLEHDLCPECRVKPQYQHLIILDITDERDASERLTGRIMAAVELREAINHGH